MRNIKRFTIVVLTIVCSGFLSAPPASAYGANTWQAQPYMCNPGTFWGGSSWLYYGVAKAETKEDGNFCWNGNNTVSAAVHDSYRNGYNWAVGHNAVETYYSTPYYSTWGGFHSWGNSGAQVT